MTYAKILEESLHTQKNKCRQADFVLNNSACVCGLAKLLIMVYFMFLSAILAEKLPQNIKVQIEIIFII